MEKVYKSNPNTVCMLKNALERILAGSTATAVALVAVIEAVRGDYVSAVVFTGVATASTALYIINTIKQEFLLAEYISEQTIARINFKDDPGKLKKAIYSIDEKFY